MARCGTCGADWTAGDFDEDCRECNGGALLRECVLCGGSCGSLWKRAVQDSNEYGRGTWVGVEACRLHDRHQAPSEQNQTSLPTSFSEIWSEFESRLKSWGWNSAEIHYMLVKVFFDDYEKHLRQTFTPRATSSSDGAVQRAALARRWIRMLEQSRGNDDPPRLVLSYSSEPRDALISEAVDGVPELSQYIPPSARPFRAKTYWSDDVVGLANASSVAIHNWLYSLWPEEDIKLDDSTPRRAFLLSRIRQPGADQLVLIMTRPDRRVCFVKSLGDIEQVRRELDGVLESWLENTPPGFRSRFDVPVAPARDRNGARGHEQ